ncbi:MAP/microtubule affinity-regulating kinase 4 [Lates japonicus]|uniref:MAP/microtubule affinity-regulating kinase 4 n=1 Tax=Lates japonicus TaxID=270547 RepID=A0AAD3MF64_LATJO|nr:MAP/microtubule affinity-regulating kinase 4 [Lates japonicus]
MEIWTAAVLSSIDSLPAAAAAALCSPASAPYSAGAQVTEGLSHNQEAGVRGKDEALGSFQQVQISPENRAMFPTQGDLIFVLRRCSSDAGDFSFTDRHFQQTE